MNSGYSFITPVVGSSFTDSSVSPFWSQSIYSLTLCASVVLLAGLVDRYGGNWVLFAGLAWMSVWSLIAGFATSYLLFCVSRAMQGLAGAAIIPAQTHIIGQLPMSKQARSISLATCAAMTPLGFVAGVCVASLSPEHITWRLFFWIPSAVSFVLLLVHWVSATQASYMSSASTSWKAWLDAVLIGIGSLCLFYGLAVMPHGNSGGGKALSPILIGILTLIPAIWLERKNGRHALIPHCVYRSQETRLFLVIVLCFSACLGIVVFFYPL